VCCCPLHFGCAHHYWLACMQHNHAYLHTSQHIHTRSDYNFIQLLKDNWEAIYTKYLQVKDVPAGYKQIHTSVSGSQWTAFNLCTAPSRHLQSFACAQGGGETTILVSNCSGNCTGVCRGAGCQAEGQLCTGPCNDLPPGKHPQLHEWMVLISLPTASNPNRPPDHCEHSSLCYTYYIVLKPGTHINTHCRPANIKYHTSNTS
jgi:hypothetical protein